MGAAKARPSLPYSREEATPLARIFTRQDGWQQLLTTIRRVLDTGVPALGKDIWSDDSSGVSPTPGGSISEMVREVLDDYESTRTRVAFTQEKVRRLERERAAYVDQRDAERPE